VHPRVAARGRVRVRARAPAAAIFDGHDPTARHRYGESGPTIGELAMALQRTNFAIDVVHELMPANRPSAVVPSTLVVRARKLGS